MRRVVRARELWLLAVGFVLPFCALVIERNRQFPVIINPDGVNYAILAEEYAAGRLHNAVNAYWGPAISWLMAIPIALGADALPSYRAINAIVVFAIVFVAWRLTVHARFRPELRFLAIWTAGLMALGWSLEVMTPDLLMVLVMLLLFDQLVRLGDALPPRQVIAIGLLGGLGYLVKPFGLLFFVAIWAATCAYIWVRTREVVAWRHVALRWALGMGAFLAVVLPWAAALTWKYGYVTTGTSGKLNLTLVAPPGWRGTISGPPARSFEAPPFPNAVAGLDPSLSTSPTWSPFSSLADMAHIVRNSLINASDVVDQFALVLFVVGGVAILALAGISRSGSDLPELPVRATFFSVLYIGMYCLVLVNTRYIWPAILILCIAGFALVNTWPVGRSRARWASVVIALPIAVIMVIGPDWRPETGIGSETVAAIYTPDARWRRLAADAHADANLLQGAYTGTTIASNDNRARSLYISYFLDSEYYGDVLDDEAPEITRQRLREYDIEVFLYWGEPGDPKPAYLADYTISDTFEDGALRVYTRDTGVRSHPDLSPWGDVTRSA